jgi:hypothetical protein
LLMWIWQRMLVIEDTPISDWRHGKRNWVRRIRQRPLYELRLVFFLASLWWQITRKYPAVIRSNVSEWEEWESFRRDLDGSRLNRRQIT